MTAWDPAQYRKFSGHRLRPALDLLAAVPLDAPESIVDLGCGEGRVTKLLAEKWPTSTIVGVDDSEAMLAVAARELPGLTWHCADVATWRRETMAAGRGADIATRRPAAPFDLIFSNAALHWLPDHSALFPDLIRFLSPGGVLAVQMPRNFEAPSHTAIHEAAVAGPWREQLSDLIRPNPVARPEEYYHWLSPHTATLDIWETTYLQRLDGENPVAEWTKGTWLKPFLDALAGDERTDFEANYRARVAAAYPREADGGTLFPFRRLFIVASLAG